MKLSLAAEDLRAIADAIDTLDEAFCSNPLFGRLEVIRPDGDDIVGYLVPEDGLWYGFEAVVGK